MKKVNCTLNPKNLNLKIPGYCCDGGSRGPLEPFTALARLGFRVQFRGNPKVKAQTMLGLCCNDSVKGLKKVPLILGP